MSEPKWKEPPEPPAEYLDEIRHWLKKLTDEMANAHGEDYRWTNAQLDDYRNCGGWGGYYEDGYSALDAVREDMTYWEE